MSTMESTAPTSWKCTCSTLTPLDGRLRVRKMIEHGDRRFFCPYGDPRGFYSGDDVSKVSLWLRLGHVHRELCSDEPLVIDLAG